MIDIHTFADIATTARMASQAINDELAVHREVPILFLFSGGSSRILLESFLPELFDARITVGVIDERFYSDPAVNNYAQFMQTDFYRMAVARGVTTLETTPRKNETIEQMAKRYESYLKNWQISHSDGIIMATLGIGPDGHIAGIMPASPKTSSQGGPYTDDARTHQSLFDDEAQWVTGYDASYRNEYPLRVTVTLPFLRKVSFGVVYAVGKDKKNALIATLAPVGTISQTPARIIAEMPHCLLYTDQTLDTVK